ncbi:MAG: hypothetical protein K0M70_10070, partial [Arenimonas sp.]|uniref:hypothetical protein n=1 Tax=Arenimonas sp. TaxID=1872635 RepID=UPI0025C51BB7
MVFRKAWRVGLAGVAMVAALLAGGVGANAAPAAGSSGGFIAGFRPAPAPSGTMPMLSLVRTTSAPGDRRAERDAASDWRLAWLDAEGRVIQVLALPDPMRAHHGSFDTGQPVFVRFPDEPGAVLAELRDARGQLRGEIPLDALARDQAAARQVAGSQRLASAARHSEKRSGDPASTTAQARQRLDFQLDVQSQLRDRRAQRCAPGPGAGRAAPMGG